MAKTRRFCDSLGHLIFTEKNQVHKTSQPNAKKCQPLDTLKMGHLFERQSTTLK